jgi:hypothetical protein
MLINNVTAGYSDPAGVAKRGESLASAARAAQKPSEANSSSPTGSRAALGQILAKYDVKNISPTEFSEMAQKLYQAGAISESDFQELSAIRVDMESSGIAPDEQIDLTDFYQRKLKQVQDKLADADETASPQQLGALLRRYDWVQKFAVVHADPQAAGIDAVA